VEHNACTSRDCVCVSNNNQTPQQYHHSWLESSNESKQANANELKQSYRELKSFGLRHAVTHDFVWGKTNLTNLTMISVTTRMWAIAQRDGRPANIGGALCLTPQFG